MIVCDKCCKEQQSDGYFLITVDMDENMKFWKRDYVEQQLPKKQYRLCEECAKPILDILDDVDYIEIE